MSTMLNPLSHQYRNRLIPVLAGPDGDVLVSSSFEELDGDFWGSFEELDGVALEWDGGVCLAETCVDDEGECVEDDGAARTFEVGESVVDFASWANRFMAKWWLSPWLSFP